MSSSGHGGRRPGAGRPRLGTRLSRAGYFAHVAAGLWNELWPAWVEAGRKILADPRVSRATRLRVWERLAGVWGDVVAAGMKPDTVEQPVLPFGTGVVAHLEASAPPQVEH